MNVVPLGRSALRISRIGLGGASFGREIDEKTSWDILDYALDHGITLLDTAEAYGGGNAHQYRLAVYGVDDVRETTREMHSSEKIIGRWQRDRKCRDRIQICTKFSSGGAPAQVQAALRGSLERLQTDWVDIYMLHKPYPDVPIRETLEALHAEVQAGRIRTLGCSNFSAEQLREAQETAHRHGLTRLDSTQPPFSLADAAAGKALLPYCAEEEIAALTYSPLAAGFLAGKYSPSRESIPKGSRFDVIPGHVEVYFSEQKFQIVENLRRLSAETGEPMVKLAMAWVFAHPAVASVMVGARQRSQLDNALAAFSSPLEAGLKARMDAWLQ